MEDGDVVEERAERDAHHVGRWNAVLDVERPLVQDHHGARRHDEQDGRQLHKHNGKYVIHSLNLNNKFTVLVFYL